MAAIEDESSVAAYQLSYLCALRCHRSVNVVLIHGLHFGFELPTYTANTTFPCACAAATRGGGKHYANKRLHPSCLQTSHDPTVPSLLYSTVHCHTAVSLAHPPGIQLGGSTQTPWHHSPTVLMMNDDMCSVWVSTRARENSHSPISFRFTIFH